MSKNRCRILILLFGLAISNLTFASVVYTYTGNFREGQDDMLNMYTAPPLTITLTFNNDGSNLNAWSISSKGANELNNWTADFWDIKFQTNNNGAVTLWEISATHFFDDSSENYHSSPIEDLFHWEVIMGNSGFFVEQNLNKPGKWESIGSIQNLDFSAKMPDTVVNTPIPSAYLLMLSGICLTGWLSNQRKSVSKVTS